MTSIDPLWVSVTADAAGARVFYASLDAAEIELIQRTNGPASDPKGSWRQDDDGELFCKHAEDFWMGSHGTQFDDDEVAGMPRVEVTVKPLDERTPRVFQKGDPIPDDVTALQPTGDGEVIFRIARGGWWRSVSREEAEYQTACYANGGWNRIETVSGYPMTEVFEEQQ
jgi:hypothetical protein